ncbi:MAG: diguanylate cyclase [Campylobacter sp.]|nr:diguanylate cyclase [Campylobacter sp.]
MQNEIYMIKFSNDKFIELLNSLAKKIYNDSLSYFELQNFFKDIARYAAHSFTEEKSLLEKYDIDIHFKQIIINHQNFFLKEIDEICKNSDKNLKSSTNLLNFLIFWLDDHIFNKINMLIDQILFIQMGNESKKAYEISKIKQSDKLLSKIINRSTQILRKNLKELQDENKRLEELLAQKNSEIGYIKDKHRDIFSTDSITNLPNKSEAIRQMDLLFENNQEFFAMLIRYPNYNNLLATQGIRSTKESLKLIADIFQLSLESGDSVFSLNAGDFLVISPNASESNVINLANKIISKIEYNSELSITTQKEKSVLSLSILNSSEFKSSNEMLNKLENKIIENLKESSINI